MGVLLRDLPLGDPGVEGDLAGSSQPGEGEKSDLVLHLCGLGCRSWGKKKMVVKL